MESCTGLGLVGCVGLEGGPQYWIGQVDKEELVLVIKVLPRGESAGGTWER